MANFKVSEQAHFLSLEFLASESANALSLAVAQDLAKIQKQYEKKRWTKPVVVTSLHPTMFCSGGNLSDYKRLKTKAAGLKINREIQAILKRFGAWQVVKLALIEGDVLGGGMEWLGYFDFRWSTPYAVLSFWQRRIGLTPGWGGGKIWSQKIGEEKLRALLCAGELLSADQSLRLGLIDQMVSSWNIRAVAEQWIKTMDAPSARGLLKWSAKHEAEAFADRWLAPEHKAVLQKWKS